jgi:signal peptidase II
VPRPAARRAETRYKRVVTRRWKLFVLVALPAIALDQLTKLWARTALPTDEYGRGIRVSVIENFFDWQLAYNTGAAFSLLANAGGARIFFTVAALAAVGFILWTVRSTPEERPAAITALALIAGGAVGNLIDRVAAGKVTDFVLWRYYEHTWPIFNVADAALSVGVVLFLIAGWQMSRDEKRAAAAGSSGGKRS